MQPAAAHAHHPQPTRISATDSILCLNPPYGGGVAYPYERHLVQTMEEHLTALSVNEDELDKARRLLQRIQKVARHFSATEQATLDAQWQGFRVALVLGMMEIDAKRVVDVEDGGLMMVFTKDDATISFEIDYDGDIAYLYEKPGVSEIVDVPRKELATHLISRFGSL